MKSIEATGKTVELAIEAGLSELGVTAEMADTEILSHGGLFSKPRVRLTVKETEGAKALAFIEGLMEKLKVTSVAELTEDPESARIEIIGADLGFLIGYRGEVLDALQYLASLVANKDKETFKRVTVDSEGYREKRAAALEDLAVKLAEKAVRLGQSVAVEPMNPFERRIMHAKLQSNPDVTTQSEGEEPNRYLVITPKGVSPSAPRPYNRDNRSGGGYNHNSGGFNRSGGGTNRNGGGGYNRNSGGFNRNGGGGFKDGNRQGGGAGRGPGRTGGFNKERTINPSVKSGFSDIGVGNPKQESAAPKNNPGGGNGSNRYAFRSTNKRPSPYSMLSGFEDNAGLKKSKFDKE